MLKKVIIVLLILFVACSPKFNKSVTNDTIVIFPAPPDTARIQFLTSISNSIDITGKRSGIKRYILGKDEAKPIMKPYGLAIHGGKIYVCDTRVAGLDIIDLEQRIFKYFKPGGKGKLKKPINCYIDEEGYLYVADAGRRQVVVFDNNHRYVTSFGDAKIIKPTDVFVYQDKIWITDVINHKVLVYSKNNYELIFSIPDAEPDSTERLYSPINLYVCDDKVYVSDIGGFKIQIYNTDGVFIKSVGSYGKRMGQFVRPKGIAVDHNSILYVVDAGFENIQLFNSEGALLMFFGGGYKGPGYMWLPAKVVIDYDHLKYFQKYVHESFDLKYLIFVTNQFGPDKISVYGFVEPKKLI